MILSPLSDHLNVVIETDVEQQMQFFTLQRLWTLKALKEAETIIQLEQERSKYE
jgi:hypothetical protein